MKRMDLIMDVPSSKQQMEETISVYSALLRSFLLMGLLWKAVLSLLLPVGLPMLITLSFVCYHDVSVVKSQLVNTNLKVVSEVVVTVGTLVV